MNVRLFSFVSLFLTIFFIIGLTFTQSVHAVTSVEEINKKIQEIKSQKDILDKKIEEQQKKVQETRTHATTLQNQIGLFDNRIAKIELDVQSVKKQIEVLNLEIEALGLTIQATQTKIEKQRGLITEFIRLLHREDQGSYLEILLLHNSFSEFFGRVKNITSITGELERILNTLVETKTDLLIQQNKLTENKKSLESLNVTLVAQQERLKGEINSRLDLLAKTKSSEFRYQQLLTELRAQYQAVEDEIRDFEKKLREELKSKDIFKDTGEVALSWPTDGRYITSYFHDPDYPFRYVFEHNAIDVRSPQDSPVYAAASGYVGRAKRCTSASCYSFVMIIHAGGMSTVYGHLSLVDVVEEEFVTRGQIIGYSGGMPGTVGAGPFVTGPHIHFETRINGIPVNPLDYLLNL